MNDPDRFTRRRTTLDCLLGAVVLVVLLAVTATPARALDLDLTVALAAEPAIYARQDDPHFRDGHPVGVVLLRVRGKRLEGFALHASAIGADDKRGGVNLVGVGVRF